MAKDRLRRRIAAALADPSGRDSLKRILAQCGVNLDGDGESAFPAALHAILDMVRDPIITIDHAGIVLSCNSAAARVLSAAPAEILGEDIAAQTSILFMG